MITDTYRILVVDDDSDLLELLEFALRRAGFEVILAESVDEGLASLSKRPALAVFDINLGARDGFELLREARRGNQIPILMLTARDAEDDVVRALEMGADDYITKPFSYRELIARIRTNLRRAGYDSVAPSTPDIVLTVGPIVLDSAKHAVTVGGLPVDLTVTEFRLLRLLMINAGVVVTTRSVLHAIWGYDDRGASDVVRVGIHRLRRKLSAIDPNAPPIQTVHGVGFLLQAEPAPSAESTE